MKRAVLILMASVLLLGACAASYLPGTQIEDNVANRQIWDLVQRYRKDVEERDIVDLKSMISREYFDNAATTDDAGDDYGYDKLMGDVLPILKDNVKKVKYEVKLKEIVVGENKAHATFEYFARFLYTEGGKDGWIAVNDFDRLDFVREDGAWKIISGL